MNQDPHDEFLGDFFSLLLSRKLWDDFALSGAAPVNCGLDLRLFLICLLSNFIQ